MADQGLKHAASLVPVGAFAGKPAMPLTRSVLVVGSGPHARFLLKSDTVSTSHALLVHTASGWYFRDLVSRTHTILNGKSLRESSIKSGDTLTIGKFVFHFVSVGTAETLPPPTPAALEITDAEIPVPIDTRTMLIGRRVGCEIRLIEESVSLVHAALFEQDGVHYIRDLYSRTGTFLNGKKVHQEPLKFGDIVVIGETTIRYVPDQSLGQGDQRGDLVELEPFSVTAGPRIDARVGSPNEASPLVAKSAEVEALLNGSMLGGSALSGSGLLNGSLANESALGASAIREAITDRSPVEPPVEARVEARTETPIIAERDESPVSLVPTEVTPTRDEAASAAGVALDEVPSPDRDAKTVAAEDEITIAEPPTIVPVELADESADETSSEDAESDFLADRAVLPINSRDAFHAPIDEIAAEVRHDAETPEVAAPETAPAEALEPAIREPKEDLPTPAEFTATHDVDALTLAVAETSAPVADNVAVESEATVSVPTPPVEAARAADIEVDLADQVEAVELEAESVDANEADLPEGSSTAYARDIEIERALEHADEPSEVAETPIALESPSDPVASAANDEDETDRDAHIGSPTRAIDAMADLEREKAEQSRALAEAIEADVLGLPVDESIELSTSEVSTGELGTRQLAATDSTDSTEADLLSPTIEASLLAEPEAEIQLPEAPVQQHKLTLSTPVAAETETPAIARSEPVVTTDVERRPLASLALEDFEDYDDGLPGLRVDPDAPRRAVPAAEVAEVVAPANETPAEPVAEHAAEVRSPAVADVVEPVADVESIAVSALPPATTISAVVPFAAAEGDHVDERPLAESIFPGAIVHEELIDEVVPAAHEPAPDAHEPLEPPGIEADALPHSSEVTELAALQARIQQALTDPSTMSRQPLLPEEPHAPAPSLSEAARRAHTIAHLLESNEEFEEEAEREAQSIEFAPVDESAAAPVIEVAAEPLAEDLTPAAAFEMPPVAIDLPALPPLEVPGAIEFEGQSVAATTEDTTAEAKPVVVEASKSESDTAANVVEATSPDAIAEIMRVAESGVAVGTRDVAEEGGAISLAAGASAVIGDEDELVATSPAVEDVVTADVDSAEATAKDLAPQVTPDEPMSESAADHLVEPLAEIASVDTAAAELAPAEALTDEVSAADAVPLEEPAIEPAPTGKGRRGRKSVTAPKPRKATASRKPPRGKRGATEVDTAASESADAITPIVDLSPVAPAIEASSSTPPNDPLGLEAAANAEESISPFADDKTIVRVPATTSSESAAFTSADASAESTHSPFAAETRITTQTQVAGLSAGDAEEANAEVDTVEPLSQAMIEAPASLDAIAEAVQPAPLPIDEVIEPSRVALEPDELPTVIEDDRAPVEADHYHAGEMIATAPVTIEELPVELVTPAVDPDRGELAERAALETTAAEAEVPERPTHSDNEEAVEEVPTAEVVETPREDAVSDVVIADEDDEVATLDPTPRPILGLEADIASVEEDADEAEAAEETTPAELAIGDLSAMADAVGPVLATGVLPEVLIEEVADDSVVETVEITSIEASTGEPINESFTTDDLASVPVVPMAFTVIDSEPVSSAEVLAITGEQPEASEELAPSVEGNWLAPGDAVVAAALADSMPESTTDSTAGLVSDASVSIEHLENDVTAVTIDLTGPAEIVEANEPLIVEPASLGGSTLSTAASLPMESSVEIESLERVSTEPVADASIEPAAIDENSSLLAAAELDETEVPGSPVAVPSSSVVAQSNQPTGIVNVSMPSMEEMEATFHDAFADALAMAEGANFAKPAPAADLAVPAAVRPPAPKWELDESLLDQAEAHAAKAAADAAGRAAAARAPAPKWELDESLLDQAEANAKAGAPMPGPMGAAGMGSMSNPAAFMSLGGIGWIGDEAADEFEAVPGTTQPISSGNGIRSLPAGLGGSLGNGSIGGAMSARRQSRRRRPVPGEVSNESIAPEPQHEVASISTPDEVARIVVASAPETPTVEAPAVSETVFLPTPTADAAEALDELDVLSDLSADDIAKHDDTAEEAESISAEIVEETLPDVIADTDDALVLTDAELSDAPTAIESIQKSHEHVFADHAMPADGPSVSAAELPTPTVLPLALPPRPNLKPRTRNRADVDETLTAAASLSPFAEQALPLVDAFSGATPPQLDEVLAKLGAAEGKIKGSPTITQDRPANNSGVGSAAPFASHAQIEAGVSSGVKRSRQRINKFFLLLTVMTTVMAVAGISAACYPVPVRIVGTAQFLNVEKKDSVEQALIHEKIRSKLQTLDQGARQRLDDRYGNGFLDRRELFASVVEKSRFDDAAPGTLILEYPSTINQQEGDVARMNALLAEVVKSNSDMIDAQHKLIDVAQTLERSIARDRDRRTALASEAEHQRAIGASGPDGKDVRKAEVETTASEEARKAAARELDAREAELKRLEANPVAFVPASLIQEDSSIVASLSNFAGMIADISDGLPASPTTKPAVDSQAELARLTAQLEATTARLDQVEAAQNPEAKKARDGFDASLEAFAADVEAARTSLSDRPELVAYIENAQKLQDQIRKITETLIRRQQQGLTRLNELKQKIVEANDEHRGQRAAGDDQLKGLLDQIAINERLLNSAKDDHTDPEVIADLKAKTDYLKSAAGARQDLLNDPAAESVNKQLEDMLKTTQRDMEADRADNEKMLADMQEAFRSQQPAVEKLPDDQKKLGEALAGKLAQIDLARQRYADSLSQAAGGEALQVTELRKKAEELNAAIARVKPLAEAESVAQAADMERRAEAAKAVDAARSSVLAARTARDQAEAAYDAKSKVLASLVSRRDAASAARQRVEAIDAEDETLKSRMQTTIADQKTNEVQLATAVVPNPNSPPTVRALEPPHGDPRATYGLSAIGIIGLCFAPFLIREHRQRVPAARAATTHGDVNVVPGNAHIA